MKILVVLLHDTIFSLALLGAELLAGAMGNDVVDRKDTLNHHGPFRVEEVRATALRKAFEILFNAHTHFLDSSMHVHRIVTFQEIAKRSPSTSL